MNQDLAIIKKKYGEKMMQFCRTMFPTLLEEKGLLSGILLSNFEPNKFLYNDIISNNIENDFETYIYSFTKKEEQDLIITEKSPKELLDEAGYILYECKSESDIQSFKKYYIIGERLCTFRGGRLERCHVFFAVKKNVKEIKRENFKNPDREDEYGTSVISIQFSRGTTNVLSIKNRYNHTVNSPDATFSNNLDNIIEGLTESFEREYSLNFGTKKQEFEIPGYVKASDGKYYKYNYEMNNIYYCPNNIIIDNFKVINDYREKEKYIVIDNFVIDLVNKRIELYDKETKDGFLEGLQNIEKIKITKEGNEKIIEIKCQGKEKNIIIVVDKLNRIIKYKNENLEKIGDFFLNLNKELEEIHIPNVHEIGNYFINKNNKLKAIELPNLEIIGNRFLECNTEMKTINLPKTKVIGDCFLQCNRSVKEVKMPNLIEIGNFFMQYNQALKTIELAKLNKIGNNFLSNNDTVESINLPSLREIGNYFLEYNTKIKYLSLPELETIGDNFLTENSIISVVNLPKVKIVGSGFLTNCNNIEYINLISIVKIGNSFTGINNYIKELNLPNLIEVGNYFMSGNTSITTLKLPKLTKVGDYFFKKNTHIQEAQLLIELPNLQQVGAQFLEKNEKNGKVIAQNRSIKNVKSAPENIIRKIINKIRNKKNSTSLESQTATSRIRK